MFWLGTMRMHFEPCAADGDTVLTDGKCIFILYRSPGFPVQVNKWSNAFLSEELIQRQCIMSGVDHVGKLDPAEEKSEDRFLSRWQ